jgi:hypothetical protein
MAVAASSDANAHFVAKWQQREPEMVFAEVFCPAADKPLFRSWGALLHELREAVFELSDPSVARAKSTWWAEELLGLARGESRHPISASLLGNSAPWTALARAILELPLDPPRAADTREAFALLAPLAQSALQVESALFAAQASEEAGRALVAHWLLQRLPSGLAAGDQARLPMHLLARHGMDTAALSPHSANALLRDWSLELLAAAPEHAEGAAWLRRSRLRFDRTRLQKIAHGHPVAPLAPWSSLWQAWRAARSV